MGISLLPRQTKAVGEIKNGSILCGGVGSGKSRAAIAYYYVTENGVIDADEYIPMGKYTNWQDAKNFKPRDLYIITTARKRDELDWDKEMLPFLLARDVEVNLYSNKVVVDSWNNILKYKTVKDAFFIFDEQRVVGYGPWSKAFIEISKSNRWILLSATPGDTWSDYIPVFIANGFFKNKTEFDRDHVIYCSFSKYRKIDRYIDTRKLVRLRDKILVDMDFNRHTVAHHEIVPCEYDVKLYKEVTKNRWNIKENRPIVNAAELCGIWRGIVNTDPSRMLNVDRILAEKNKAIIFYNFNYELDLLYNKYKGSEYEVAEWNGRKHQPVPDSDKWVYLVQYTAGAEGWNCILTDTIILYSQNYSYKVLIQSCGRIDRLNTPYTDLYYYHFKSLAPIDVGIRRAINTKKKFNEGHFTTAGGI